MSLPILAILVIGTLALGYRFYGQFVASQFALTDKNPTPAVQVNDGADFVPTRPFYLLGQHFSAIAAAGPIAGPIIACQMFGWLPCVLWIVLGVIFIGAVHDFASLVASVRHGARSVAEIMKENIGGRAYLAMMAFIWIALLYVIVAFTDITAGTFVGITEEFKERDFSFNPGGAVAASSVMYLMLSILMGLVQKKFNPPLWLLTLIFVPATLGAVWAGTQVSTLLLFTQKTWGLSILVYCFVASLLPVWLLLQPRGYLGGFVLYMALAVGVIGIFFGQFQVQQPAFKGWSGAGATDALFPFLFVTIACGACSGFHGLVCSGTTSKQIEKESHCRPVGFGGMLLEAFVAMIALSTVMILSQQPIMPGPGKIYGNGMGYFLTILIGEQNILFAITFGAMAFSTFIFDTLDVATRLGRYILQELFNLKGPSGAAIATAATVALPVLLVSFAGAGSYRQFWTLFGTTNQLLAALSLLGLTVWMKKTGKNYWITLIPMIFVMSITLWSLLIQTSRAFSTFSGVNISFMNGMSALVLISLTGLLIYDSVQTLKGELWQEKKLA
ncbi:MAG: carbon starvation protein CstA [Elusimicrobia bacterium RIFCSPLOWO2_01_FULL_54_10]|nr:MAG: carbon starvation protein CstA [Elusimicrobia bacterium RIFCSPLOWO2_01_FULL_54_10]